MSDIFHIKLFTRPGTTSVVYVVEKNLENSHFSKVSDYRGLLYRPGLDPDWLPEVLTIQKKDLALAREFALNKINHAVNRNNHHISIGFEWDQSAYQYDYFMSSAMQIAGWT